MFRSVLGLYPLDYQLAPDNAKCPPRGRITTVIKEPKIWIELIKQTNKNRPSLMEACQNIKNTEILFFLHPNAKIRDKSYSTNSNNLLLNKKHGYIHLLWSKKKLKKTSIGSPLSLHRFYDIILYTQILHSYFFSFYHPPSSPYIPIFFLL